MTKIDIERQLEAADLAHARELVEKILTHRDLLSWDVLLTDNVTLSLRLGTIGIDRIGLFDTVGDTFQAFGKEDAKKVLKSIYPELKKNFSVTTTIVSGYDAALLGNWAIPSTRENEGAFTMSVVLYMVFDGEAQIERMTITKCDLQPMIEAIRVAVASSADAASV